MDSQQVFDKRRSLPGNRQSAFAFVYNLEKLKIKYYNQYLNGKERPMPNSKFKKYYHSGNKKLSEILNRDLNKIGY